MTYKIISFGFGFAALFMGLIFAKSGSLGITSKVSLTMSLFTVPCFLWSIASAIFLFHWWAILVAPLSVLVASMISASFLMHLRSMGDSLLSGQAGYGFFMLLFSVVSIIPHCVKWLA